MAELLQTGAEANESSLEGCPDPTSGRAIIVSSLGDLGPSKVCHQFRDGMGNPLDLVSIMPLPEDAPDPERKPHMVLIQDALCSAGRPVKVEATIATGTDGQVCFEIPAGVTDRPGIYNTEMLLFDLQGRPYAKDSTLVSVERSLLRDYDNGRRQGDGPLTLGEIRMQLRDYAGLNSAWDNAEFSDAEIVHAILQPIREFNETLPRVLGFTASNFPWRQKWLDGVTATLMRMAANWYMRNSRKIQYGDGKTSDDKNKAAEYLQLAEVKWLEYRRFCEMEQVVANYRGGVSSLGGTIH